MNFNHIKYVNLYVTGGGEGGGGGEKKEAKKTEGKEDDGKELFVKVRFGFDDGLPAPAVMLLAHFGARLTALQLEETVVGVGLAVRAANWVEFHVADAVAAGETALTHKSFQLINLLAPVTEHHQLLDTRFYFHFFFSFCFLSLSLSLSFSLPVAINLTTEAADSIDSISFFFVFWLQKIRNC